MKIGIALGGGGARGFAHIGVLKALAEAGIDCEIISGTSIGSLVGAIYSCGSLEKLEAESLDIKLKDIPGLLSPTWSKLGIFNVQNGLERLNDFIDVSLIEELPKPFAAVSVDVNRSEIVTFTKGDLRTALRASISIPAVFTPVVIGEQLLIDGGTLEPVPVKAARDLGADFVIAVDLFGAYPQTDPEIPRELLQGEPDYIESAINYLARMSDKLFKSAEHELPNIIQIIENTLAVSQQHLTKYRFKEHPAEMIIAPPISNIGLLDFHRGEPIVEIGKRAAEKSIPELEKRLKSFE